MKMKHYVGILACSLLLLIIINGSYSKPVNVYITPERAKTFIDSYIKFRLVIENTESVEDDIVLSVKGSHLEWLNLESYYFRIYGKEKKTLDVGVYPKKKGIYNYYVDVISRRSGTIDTVTFTVEVIENESIAFEGLSVKREDNTVIATAKIESNKEKNLTIDFEMTGPEGEIIDRTKKSISVIGSQEFTAELSLPERPMAGNYEVTVKVEELDAIRSVSFAIPPVRKVERTVAKKGNVFYEEFTITVENKGNVKEEEYIVRQPVYTDKFLYIPVFLTSEPKIVKEAGGVVYEWVLRDLKQGEKVVIRYRIDYWPYYLFLVVIAIVVILLSIYIYHHLSMPSIKKSYRKHGKDLLILIEIKGSWIKNFENVLVKDRVSPLAKVVKEFDTPKPVIRVSDSGTELAWKLTELKARDEMIYYYRIKPLIEASLKMPSAYLRFKVGKKTKVKYSNQLIIENY